MAGKNPFDGKAFVKTLETGPGVYLMRDVNGKALYVGKARNLRRRVASYFDGRDKGPRLNMMIRRIGNVEVAVTRTEAEALLLENEWIKALKPRYNINLRDDKSYPWIRMTTDQAWPRVGFYRGSRGEAGEYFGPYASAGAVRASLDEIYRLFGIRQCRDSVFSNRSRPCLQYQINRCTAPCVGYISREEYRRDVDAARAFLKGRSQAALERLGERMKAAAEAQDYERAADYRDRIARLQQMQSRQHVTGPTQDCDVLALARQGGQACIQVVSFRLGRNVGGRAWFPGNLDAATEDGAVMAAFIGQFYADRTPPAEILVSHEPDDKRLWQEALGSRRGGAVRIAARVRDERARRLEWATTNAEDALRRRLSEYDHIGRGLEALAELLDLEARPERIECFDISHISGAETVASCVVFGPAGAEKKQYRHYNIADITPGDDYAAMRQVLHRRYRRVIQDDLARPDLIVIDGGRGQFTAAVEILSELGLEGVPTMAVAKGPARRSGWENWILPGGVIRPGPDHAASHLIQQVRDEAHRFAVAGHRRRRQKRAQGSPLEAIPGVGPGRRKALLNHFGGLKGIQAAGVEELVQVRGISRKLAAEIVRHMRDRS